MNEIYTKLKIIKIGMYNAQLLNNALKLLLNTNTLASHKLETTKFINFNKMIYCKIDKTISIDSLRMIFTWLYKCIWKKLTPFINRQYMVNLSLLTLSTQKKTATINVIKVSTIINGIRKAFTPSIISETSLILLLIGVLCFSLKSFKN